MNEYPLVSIPVITYNSSSYIIEGLETIKNQTYKNIELVISDDSSTDNTVELCKKWIDENKNYFKRAIIITTDQNTGVAGNLNRAIRECQGEWIKSLSGDDKFLPYSIEEYVKFINQNPYCEIAFAKLYFYGESQDIVIETRRKYENDFYPKIRAPYKKQYKENLKNLFLPGPGLIYKKSLWKKVGGFDEDYPFCEEIPFTTKVLDYGVPIAFIDNELYKYHVRKDSLSNTHSKISSILRNNIRSYFRKEKRTRMIRHGLILNAIDQTISFNLEEARETNDRYKIMLYSIIRYFSPLRYYYAVRTSLKNIRKCLR